MMRSPDRLFELLPAVYRSRDADEGHPLRALLQVVAEQAGIVEDDIDRLYDNWFIETCQDWVVPYLGELIGHRMIHDAGEPGVGSHRSGPRRPLRRILAPRREVANTLRYRRRKGTLALLELLARDVAGWPARSLEFYRLLAWTQPLNHQRPERGRSVDLRDGDALDRIDGPFDTVAHTVDVRRLSSPRAPGRSNIPNVGVFVWRLRAYPVTRAPAYCLEAAGSHCYTFSVLGNDAPLFAKPGSDPSGEDGGSPLQVPAPLRHRPVERALEDYYGVGRSFEIRVDGWAGYSSDTPLPPEALVVADLSGWSYRPARDRVAVDPVLGRIAFPPRQLPRKGVWVSYHQGFSDDMGGGEYRRPIAEPAGAVRYRVGDDQELVRIADALARWREERPEHAVIELVDGGVYVEQITLELEEGQSLQIRAANRTRPVLRLMDWQTARPDALWVHGAEGSRFTLDGLLVAGRSVHCEGPLAEVTIRHCTLVPGWSIESDCRPRRPAEPSLELTDTEARVAIERTILGSIQVSQEVGTDPIRVRISDSILDATSPEREAIGAPSWPLAHAALTIERTTVFGEIWTHAIDLAEDSIFMGRIRVARRQRGCMRFSYVTPGSRTPRRYRCQPDLVEDAVRSALPKQEIGPDAHAAFVVRRELEVGSSGAGEPCPPSEGSANLELELELVNATPAVGDPFPFTLVVRNRGPKDARGVEVTLTGPSGDCLRTDEDADVENVLSVSQGTVEMADAPNGDGPVLWYLGALRAGGRAELTARGIEVADGQGDCGTQPSITAAITAGTLQGDGRAFVAERIRRERQRVQPRFNSTRYGTPTYAQLAPARGEEISRGAEDESEMGAFHDLFQPQRAANLSARLEEFVPASMDVGIVYAS